MALAQDASTPAVVQTTATSASTAAFTPPVNSLLVMTCAYNDVTNGDHTLTISNSGTGLTWTHLNNFQAAQSSYIFWTYLTSAPGSMTVTVTNSSDAGVMVLYPLVLTGALNPQSGNHSNVSAGNNGLNAAFTPNTIGSWIVGCGALMTGGTSVFTPESGWTTTGSQVQSTGSGNPFVVMAGRLTSPVSSLTSTTCGWTSTASGFLRNWDSAFQEIQPASSSSPVTINLAKGAVALSAPPPVPIAGTAVSLPVGRVNVDSPIPTVTAVKVTSGGPGQAGLIKITYISPNTQALASSISPIATSDPYGNAIPVGYMGPVSAIAPGSAPTTVETWHGPLALTDASASGNGVNGFWYRYRSDNEVELLWDITLSAGAGNIASLPSGYVPAVAQNIVSSWYGTGPAAYSTTFAPSLSVSTGGVVSVQNCGGLTISLCGREKITLDGSL